MEKAVIYIIVIGVISGFTSGAGLLPDGPLNRSKGWMVIFTTTWPPGKPFATLTWKFGDKHIITSNVTNIIDPEYVGRITFFPSTGSLWLRKLALNDSGVYEVSITPTEGPPVLGNTTLGVYEKIQYAFLRPSTKLPVEGKFVTLTCGASTSIVTRKWYQNTVELIPTDNMTLSDNDRVLFFNTVNRKDTGKYICNISNPVSNVMVMDFMTVNYGPDNVKIIGDNEIVMNTPLKLSCSADSTPTASYTWMFNGSEIPNNGSEEFFKDRAEFSDSGNYTCRARNNVTGRTSSVVHALTVTEKTPGGLSAGVIAAIVICTIVVVAAGTAGGYYCYKKKNNNRNRNTSNKNPQTQNTELEENNFSPIYEDVK